MEGFTEIKKIITEQGVAWEEFKRTNDELVKSKADGKAVADIEAKCAKITADMDKIGELKEQLEGALLKANRPAASNVDEEFKAEVKQFNQIRKSFSKDAQQNIDEEVYQNYKNAFFNVARKGNIDMLSDIERKALQAGVDTDGGYLLPVSTVGRVIQRIYELSPIRQIASAMTISTDAIEGINDLDEASCGWVSELGTRSDTNTPVVGKYRIEAHELYAQPKATQKLLDDSAVDIEAYLAGKVADKFARVEAAAFINGNGAGQPRGFALYTTAATVDGSRAWGTIEHIKTGANGDFAASSPADVLFELTGAFKTAYLQNARFVTRREVISKLRKLKEATTNAYMWQPGLQAGQPDRLLGYPIIIAQDMPSLATNSLSVAFGDFSEAYQIVDRIGIRTLRDPYTDKPYVKFYSTKRVGGGVVNFEAIKFLKFAA